MSSLLRHTPEGFRREYLSKCSQRFEQKGGSTTTYTNWGLYESVDYQPVGNQEFPPSFYEQYNANKHDEVLAKLAGKGKIDELLNAMVKLGVVYYGPYLKNYAGNSSVRACLFWNLAANDNLYQVAHRDAIAAAAADGVAYTEDYFVNNLPGPNGGFTDILDEILKGETYKNSPVGITQDEVNTLAIALMTDIGKLVFLAYMEWPKMANDTTKYETDATLIDQTKLFKARDLTLDARVRNNIVTRVLGWFAAPNNLNNKRFINPLAPQSSTSEYFQAAINALPYDEFFKVGKYDAMKNLLNEHRQKYMTTPSTPTGTYLPVPVFVNLGNQPGGGKEDPFFFFSSNATDIMKGVKLYLAGKKKQAFSPESEKQIMSAISNVAKHEKEYFAKIQEVNSQRYGSKYSMEEKQAMVDTIGKTLTLKINRLKDLINSVVTQAIA